MKPVSRVNTATDDNKENRNQERNTTSSSQGQGQNPSQSSEGFSGAIGNFTDRAQDMASQAIEKVQEYGESALEQTGSFVRRYPAQTLLAGLGVGLILGWALSRR